MSEAGHAEAPHEPSELQWYGVRTIVRYDDGDYEERLTIWRATSLDDALARAEVEADEYAEILEGENVGIAQAYGPIDDGLVEGAEVFSLIRQSSLPPRDYVMRFFSTGDEYQQLDTGSES